MSKHGKEEAMDTAEAPDSSDQQSTESQKKAPRKRKVSHVDDASPAAHDAPANDKRYKYTGLQALSKKRLPTSLQVVPPVNLVQAHSNP